MTSSSSLIVVITGASRGIGLQLTTVFAAHGHRVIALCRDPQRAESLAQVAATDGRVCIMQMDVVDAQQVHAAAASVAASYDHVDILINNAGVTTAHHPDDTFSATSVDEYAHVLRVNTLGPFLVTQAFTALLNAAAPEREERRPPVVANMSSTLGSIEKNRGGALAYGASKAALNHFTVTLAKTNPCWTVVSVSPGWVQTDMGNHSNQLADVPIEKCGAQLYSLLATCIKHDQSGKFLTFENDRTKVVPW